jgi:NTE family protein
VAVSEHGPGPVAGAGTTRALVLGGGGVTGIAWEIGVLCGLRRAGVDLTTADMVIGTSAGSFVGALVATGVDLEQAAAAQRRGPDGEPRIEVDLARLFEVFGVLTDPDLEPRAAQARIGALALATPTVPEQARIDAFAARLPRHDWPPARRLLVTAVDAETGEQVAWDGDSGVPLVQAVAASCAVPSVFPPITIEGRHYIDGGVGSATNAYLAAGAGTVVVIAPMAAVSPFGAPPEELAELRRHATVRLIGPDDAALAAIGPNVLDAGRRAHALDAGLRQGGELAGTVGEIWPAAP